MIGGRQGPSRAVKGHQGAVGGRQGHRGPSRGRRGHQGAVGGHQGAVGGHQVAVKGHTGPSRAVGAMLGPTDPSLLFTGRYCNYELFLKKKYFFEENFNFFDSRNNA